MSQSALICGKHLLTYSEFFQMAFGSPGGLGDSNENAWTAKINTRSQKTGGVINAISSIGCRDAVGNVWEWLNQLVTRAEHSKITGSGTSSSSDGSCAVKAYTNGNGHYHATNDSLWRFDTVSPFPDGYGNIYEYNDYCYGFAGWVTAETRQAAGKIAAETVYDALGNKLAVFSGMLRGSLTSPQKRAIPTGKFSNVLSITDPMEKVLNPQ